MVGGTERHTGAGDVPAAKLRGLLLTVIVVSAALGGVLTLSGTAAAAGNDVGIDGSTEAGGTVAVVFNASSFSDPPEKGDLDLWIDGTRVVDDGDNDTNLGGQTWGVDNFTRSGPSATFDIQTDGSTEDIDPNRNLTVEFEGVARPGAVNTDPGDDVTVTQAVVTQNGTAESAADAPRVYRSDDIAIEATTAGTDIFIQNVDTGSAAFDGRTTEDSRYLTIDTSTLDTGTTYFAEFDGDPDNRSYFDIADLQLTATATETSIDDITDLTVDVSTVQASVPFTATLLNGSDSVVETITRDHDSDGTSTVNFGTQSPGDGPYSVRVVDNRTNASVTTSAISVLVARPSGIDAAVEAGGDVEVLFNASSFTDPPESGDVDLWVDGTRVVDDGGSAATLGGQTWTIANFGQSGRNATFTIRTDGTTADIDPTQNLTVEFEGVTRTGDNPDPETEVTTTQAVVREGGFADTEGTSQRVFAGGPVAVATDSLDGDVFVPATGQALRTGPDSSLLTLSTRLLPTGRTAVIQFDGDETNDQFVTVRDLGLTATATDTTIDDRTPVSVNVTAVRGASPVTATLRDGGSEVARRTATLDATGDASVDFGSRSAGQYTVRVVDNATGATATTAGIAVTATGGGGGGNDDTDDDVVYEPRDIRALIDLPATVRPLAAERATVVLSSGGSEATLTGDAAVARVGFDEYVPGLLVAASVDRVGLATAPVGGRTLTAARLTVPDGAGDTHWTVRLRVDGTDLAAAGATTDDLQVVRYADGEWRALNTTVSDRTDSGVVLAAETAPADYFAVRATAAPTAVASSPTAVTVGDRVTLDATGSTTPYGAITSYSWSVDDRTVSGPTATVTLDEPGTYTAELTVTTDAGETATTTTEVTAQGDDRQQRAVTATATESTATESTATESLPATDARQSEPTGTTGGSGPGFGVAAALLTVSLAVLARRTSLPLVGKRR